MTTLTSTINDIKNARRWYVTASHSRPGRTHEGRERVPYGTSHVRRVGAPETACGLPACNWGMFWNIYWDETEELCEQCRRAARLDHVEPRRNYPIRAS